jgi:hypothetical protein
MRLRIILFVVASIISLSSCKYFENHRLFSKDIDTLLDITAEKVSYLAVDKQLVPIEEPKTLPVVDEPKPVTGYGYVADKYYMIVGCFQNQNFAERYAEKVKQMGYTAQILESSNGFYKVSAKSYSNFIQAVGEIDIFRSTITSRAWIHVRK